MAPDFAQRFPHSVALAGGAPGGVEADAASAWTTTGTDDEAPWLEQPTRDAFARAVAMLLEGATASSARAGSPTRAAPRPTIQATLTQRSGAGAGLYGWVPDTIARAGRPTPRLSMSLAARVPAERLALIAALTTVVVWASAFVGIRAASAI